MDTYTDLASALPQWLDVGTDNVSAVLPQIIENGEKRIFREIRVPEMETSLSATIASGVITVPSDYVELRFAYVDGNPTQYLQMVPVSYIYDRYPTRGSSGKPIVMARDGSNFIFGPYPDSDYTIKGTYFKRPVEIADTTTPLLISKYSDLYLFASLIETEPLLGRNERMALWEAKYRMVKEAVNGEGSKSRLAGNLSVRIA
jgi:hypothetical protein